MSGYVASARIVRAAPRLASPARITRESVVDPLPGPALATVLETDADREHVADVAERLGAFRERWSQLTFFLLDAESWR
jgi:hypothetical protein